MSPENKPRVFLDTNVIFSALYSPNGTPGKIIGLFIESKINVVISRQVLEELVRTIRAKLPQVLPALRTLLTNVTLEIQNDPPAEQVEKLTTKLDFADASILAAAINAKVDYFITGDSHFLNIRNIIGEHSFSIISPAEFVKLAGLK